MRSLLLAVATASLLASPTGATTFVPEEVDCPVCGLHFVALQIASTNSFGGRDADFCPHPRGSPTVPYGVWTCPRCAYTNDPDEFAKAVDEDRKKRILDELRSPVPLDPAMSQHDIPGWVKYELRATLRAWDGAPETELGNLWLLGAWSERLQSGRHLAGLRTDAELQATIDRVSKAIAPVAEAARRAGGGEDADPYEVDLAVAEGILGLPPAEDAIENALRSLIAGRIRRERGELTAALALFERVAADGAARPSIAVAARAFVDSIALERRHLDRAVVGLAAALDDPATPEDTRPWRRLQLAEILRHLGRRDEAEARYRSVVEQGDPPVWIVELAERGLGLVGSEHRVSPERKAELGRRRLEALLARLEDPEEASDAAREIGHMGDPAAIPGLVRALESPREETWQAAAEALEGLPDPEGQAVRALVERLPKETSEQVRVSAVRALARKEGAEATRALETALDDPASIVRSFTMDALVERLDAGTAPRFRAIAADAAREESDRRSAIRGLGLLRDVESVPLLLESFAAFPSESALALDRIANTAFWPHIPHRGAPKGSIDDFRAWWEAHRGETRDEWLRAGFRAAGFEVAALDESAIPALLPALEHAHQAVRFNAWWTLHDLTGQSFGKEVLTKDRGHGADKMFWEEDCAPLWRAWWEREKR